MASTTSDSAFVYVGTYTDYGPDPRGDGEGIYIYRLDPTTSALQRVSITADVPNPSFLTVHPNGRTLYAVNETTTTDGQAGGAVRSFAIDPAGVLTPLNRQPSHGSDPCHLSVDGSGQVVLVANYTSGSVAVLPVEADGRLGPASDVRQHAGSSVDPDRQAGPHAHFIAPDPTNRFALVADLGLDQVVTYRLDLAAGTLLPTEAPPTALQPGSGPRHLAFHPTLAVLYVINELASTISTCRWDATIGSAEIIETISTLPAGFTGQNSCAEIRVAPSGRFVYGSNRGHDSIAIFAVDQSRGTLKATGHVATHGKSPRNFTIDPSGRLLFAANQESSSIMTFGIDADTGGLREIGQFTYLPSPVCIRFGL
ncbi:MAG: lactonase family protein [Vicinamibacterales bacterium]